MTEYFKPLTQSEELSSLKPTPLKIKPEGIPCSMRERNQWIGWKYEWDGTKWTKPPFHASGNFKASTTNATTWSTFEEAYAGYLAGNIDGIGYVFGQDDGLVGIDVDHCIDFLTKDRKFTREEAELILLKFLGIAYIERSVGGDGMHLIVQGQALRCGKGDGDLKFIEVYDATSPRYFTFSGHRLPRGQEEPLPAQEELNWLHESFFRAKGQSKVSPLVGGVLTSFSADNPAVDPEDVELLVDWAKEADFGAIWRAYGEKPANLDSLFGEEWKEPLQSPSELDMRFFGKLAWYVVLHHRIDDDVVGHVLMAVYRQWPGYRGEEGERKAQYAIPKVLKGAFDERERQRQEGTWGEAAGVRAENITGSISDSSAITRPEKLHHTNDSPIVMPKPFPGAMEEIVTFTLRSSPKPQPDLALMSALMAMSASCSGCYYLSTGSMRLNLYGLGIAETGAGKDHPRYVATEVVRKAGGKIIAKPASGQGLEDQLVSRIPILAEIDEAAHLFQELNIREQSSATVTLNSMLLKLYSASKGIYSTRAKATNTKNIQQSMPRDIYNPMLNILGFSTPEKLGEVLTSQNIADGMMGRMLFACGQSGVKQRRADSEALPTSIAQHATRVKNACAMTNPQQPGVTTFLKEVAINEMPEAAARLDALMVEFSDMTEASDAVLGKALFARSFEKCYRIAGVLAVWDDPEEPVIDTPHIEWARQFVMASDAAALNFCDDYFHGGQTQSDGALILKIIRKAIDGEISISNERDKKFTQGGYTTHSLVLKSSKLDKKRFDEALAYLEDSERVSRSTVDDQKSNGRVYKLKLLTIEGGA